MPSEQGKAIQITKDGGIVARESPDGYLYYYSNRSQKWGVWRLPLSGGPETFVTDAVGSPWDSDFTGRGIYFMDRSTRPQATVCFLDFATRKVRSLAPVSSNPKFLSAGGMLTPSVSPDGKWLLYSGGIFTSDIMMIDNFR
jgi:streptogramin lyase